MNRCTLTMTNLLNLTHTTTGGLTPSQIAVPALVVPGSTRVASTKGCGGNTQLKGDGELHDVIPVS